MNKYTALLSSPTSPLQFHGRASTEKSQHGAFESLQKVATPYSGEFEGLRCFFFPCSCVISFLRHASSTEISSSCEHVHGKTRRYEKSALKVVSLFNDSLKKKKTRISSQFIILLVIGDTLQLHGEDDYGLIILISFWDFGGFQALFPFVVDDSAKLLCYVTLDASLHLCEHKA